MILDQDFFTSITCSIDYNWLWPIMLQWWPHCYFTRLSPIEILHVSGYSDSYVCSFVSQYCCSTFTKLVTPRHLTFNLTPTISYGSNGTHVVIILCLYLLTEVAVLSLGFCKASNLIGFLLFRTCMLRVI